MNDVDVRLRDDEDLLFHTKLHPVTVLRPIALVIAVGFLLSLSDQPAVARLSMLWLCAGAIWIVFGMISFLTSELGVTNQRIVVKAGFIRRSLFEIDLGDLERVDASMPGLVAAWGRGSLIFETKSGETHKVEEISAASDFAAAARRAAGIQPQGDNSQPSAD